jgi:hypothetical protein
MGTSDEASVPFLEHAHDVIETKPTNRRLNPVSRVSKYGWMAACGILLVLTNATTLLLSLNLRNTRLDETCALHTSQSWSKLDNQQNGNYFQLLMISVTGPVLGDVQIKYSPVKFNGSLFHDTIYRQEAGPEVDAAWSALGTDCTHTHYTSLQNLQRADTRVVFAIVVPASEAERSGISLDRLRVGEEYGGPGYPAFVEGLHQLHCLVRSCCPQETSRGRANSTPESPPTKSLFQPRLLQQVGQGGLCKRRAIGQEAHWALSGHGSSGAHV